MPLTTILASVDISTPSELQGKL